MELAAEVHRVAAGQRVKDDLRARVADLAQHGFILGRVERDVGLAHNLAAKLGELLLEHLVRLTRPRVIGPDQEKLLAVVLDDIFDMRPDLLRRLRSAHEHVLVADAGKKFLALAFIKGGVEHQLVGLLHHRPRRVAFCAGEGARKELNVFLTQQTVGLLDHDARLGLGVAHDDFQRAAVRTTGGIDLFHGQLEARQVRRAIDRPGPGQRRDDTHADRLRSMGRVAEEGGRERGCRHCAHPLQDRPAAYPARHRIEFADIIVHFDHPC